jgi:hypothetical protein
MIRKIISIVPMVVAILAIAYLFWDTVIPPDRQPTDFVDQRAPEGQFQQSLNPPVELPAN